MTTIAKINFEGRAYAIQCCSEQDLLYRGFALTGDFYEIVLLEYIKGLKIEGTYIDIGANIGNHAIFFAA